MGFALHFSSWSAKGVKHSIIRQALQYAVAWAGDRLCTVPRRGQRVWRFSCEEHRSVCDTIASK